MLSEYVKSRVKDEIARQAEEEVRRQIEQFLPVSLERQAEEGDALLKKLKAALDNSYYFCVLDAERIADVCHDREARTENACIRVFVISDWVEPLKVVFKEDGEKSDYYPSDLTTLYNYDGKWFPDGGWGGLTEPHSGNDEIVVDRL